MGLLTKWRQLALHTRIIIGMLLGVGYSFLSVEMGWNDFTIKWVDPFGVIFIRLLKFIAVPLVLFSIIGGVASLPDPSRLGRLGAKTIFSYVLTTLFAVTMGVLLTNFFQPGKQIAEKQRIQNRLKYELWIGQQQGMSTTDGKNFLKDPAYAAYLSDASALLNEESAGEGAVGEKVRTAENLKDAGPLQIFVNMVPDNIFLAMSDSTKMLQIIFFGIFFGVVMLMLPGTVTRSVDELVHAVNSIFLRMVEVIMQAAPFFVFCLMAGVLAKMADNTAGVIQVFKGLLSYALVVVSGLAIMVFIIYPFLMAIFTGRWNLMDFYRAVSPAQLLAFSTSSSAATLPVTMECVIRNLRVPERIANFTLPIGATVNMDGTSMYQAIATVFLAQVHLIDLNFGQQLTIIFAATMASIGTAAVPSAGLVMLIVVLQSVGLNPAWIAIIIPVDRILDMCRTVVNVTGDMTISTIIAKTEGEMAV
jgi:Na+/H+-dicarboxylate symporter